MCLVLVVAMLASAFELSQMVLKLVYGPLF